MEFSAGEVRDVLLFLAASAREKAGEAEDLRARTQEALNELHAAWEGSRHDDAYTGKAYAATALSEIQDGLACLHRAAEIVTSAAHRM
ncbi:hypothetical protein NLX83_15485 [Allokutzneria sp. A3M-2-11 16]|uniref:hypothetical protein n=1 Tax=Allokutzneria sp. A3M-2-11 16 TaxID=2962043 RepID=UPI0020B829FF|nr:hypothetical protein [Allokutzneria sp. A3M-2-11 16]MCP3800669.1 hypothetical protein [Allokutzneria sp. A3M-2-11 16]